MTLLTVKEAADCLKMSEGYIRLAIRQKELAIYRLGKVRGVRITPEALQAFVDGKFVVSTTSLEKERAALAKMTDSLNQWVTPRDR